MTRRWFSRDDRYRRWPAVMRPGVRQGMLILLDQAFYSLSSAVVGVLIARSCSKTVYGYFVLCVSVIMTLQLVQRSVISLPLTVKSAAMNGAARLAYLGSSLIQQLVFSIGVGLILGAAAATLAVLRGELAPLLAALAVAAVALLLRDFARSVLLARLKVWWNAGLGLVANTCTVVVAWQLYRAGRLSATSGLIAGAAGALAPSLLFLALNRGEFRFDRTSLRKHVSLNWSFGKWTLGATAAASGGIRLVAWLLALLASAAEVGVFGAMQTVSGFISPVTSGAAAFVTPKLARRAATADVAAAERLCRRLLNLAAALAIAYVLAMAVFGKTAVRMLFRSGYDDQMVLLVIAASVALEAIVTPLRAMLRVRDRPELELYGSLAAAAAALAVAFATIPKLGALGAALSLLTGGAGQLAAFAIADRRASKAVRLAVTRASAGHEGTIRDSAVRSLSENVDILGVEMSIFGSYRDAVDLALERIRSRQKTFCVAINPEKVLRAWSDDELRSLLNGADMRICDGIGTAMAARILHGKKVARVTGVQLFLDLVEAAAQKGLGVYLLGGSAESNEGAARALRARHSALRIVGSRDGYFKDDAHVIREINAAGTDMLFVAMGSPKQEQWIETHRPDIDAAFYMGVGGSLDIVSGRARWAPEIFRRTGTEFLYRLVREPSRWKRQARLPSFLLRVVGHSIAGPDRAPAQRVY